MITRVIAFVGVLLVGAVAPARAWCEASCLAPAAHGDAAKLHCSTHEPAGSGPSLSATEMDDCPVIESARPTVTARLDSAAVSIVVLAPPRVSALPAEPSFDRPPCASTIFERSTPLRI